MSYKQGLEVALSIPIHFMLIQAGFSDNPFVSTRLKISMNNSCNKIDLIPEQKLALYFKEK